MSPKNRIHRARPVISENVLDHVIPKHYGIGHNSGRFNGDLDQALRHSVDTRTIDFATYPRLDIDPHIGMMLLMGEMKSVTMRKEIPSWEEPVTRDEPSAREHNVITHIRQEREMGRDRTVIILRFPNIFKYGRHVLADGRTDPDSIEMPVVIDIRNALEEMEGSKLRYKEDPDNKDRIGKSDADEIAQQHGFARARDMQNSRPIQLNNTMQTINPERGKSKEKALKTLEKKQGELQKKLESAQQQIELATHKADTLRKTLGDFTAADIVETDKVVIGQQKAKKALHLRDGRTTGNEEIDKMLPEMLDAESRLKAIQPEVDLRFAKLNALQSEMTKLMESKRRAKADNASFDESTYKNEYDRLRKAIYEASGSYEEVKTPASRLERKTRESRITGYEDTVKGLQVRVDQIELLLRQVTSELEAKGKETVKEHLFSQSDFYPTLVTIPVIAANPHAIKRELVRDQDSAIGPKREEINGRVQHIQSLYLKNIYPYALEGNRSWLRDALSDSPKNPYLQSTRNYFEHVFEKSKGKYGKTFDEFASNSESPLGKAIRQLEYGSLSEAALGARIAEGDEWLAKEHARDRKRAQSGIDGK